MPGTQAGLGREPLVEGIPYLDRKVEVGEDVNIEMLRIRRIFRYTDESFNTLSHGNTYSYSRPRSKHYSANYRRAVFATANRARAHWWVY